MRKLLRALAELYKKGATASPAQTESAETDYERGDYANAMVKFRLRAAQGEANAQYFIALMYHKALGVAQDYAETAKWYRLAAEQGHCSAQTNLSSLYYAGQGVEQDYAEAFRLNLLAAEQGDAFAQDNLGMMYENGLGVVKNSAKAVKWYMRAAVGGFANAQYKLGTLFYNGDRVSQDYAQAVQWYRQAASQGLPAAQNSLAGMYLEGQGVSQDVEEAAALFQLAAMQGYADAQTSLGLLYSSGQGVARNGYQALTWLLLAAEQGFARAQYNLGVIFFNGSDVARDYTEAAKWYRLSAAQGHADAQLNLASMYFAGEGVNQDLAEAFRLFLILAEEGNARALVSLAVMYYTGQGCTKNLRKAADMFRLAAEQGNSDGQRNLGVMLSRGEGVEQNDTEAAKWFKLAIAQGNTDAQLNLNALMSREESGGKPDSNTVAAQHRAIENNGINHLRKFDLLLFDLDDTLLQSGHLAAYRGRENLGKCATEYYEQLRNEGRKLDHLISEEILLSLKSTFPCLRQGVFTRAPKSYATTLLNTCFPKIVWDCVITYEDVQGQTKPHPDGVFMAKLATGVNDMARIAVIGDDKGDLLAAYQAGAYAVLFQRGWGSSGLSRGNPKRSEHYWALGLMPDAKLDDPTELVNFVLAPERYLPALEAWTSGVKEFGHKFPMRVDVRKHFNKLDKGLATNWVETHSLGRYFPSTARLDFQFMERRHALNNAILNAKDGIPYPDSWADCCAEYVLRYADKLLPWDGDLLVCTVPSSSDSAKRSGSGRLLELLNRICDRLTGSRERKILFEAGVLEYTQGASSNKSLDQEGRFMNVRDHLLVSNKTIVKGRTVLVLDDVVTSGATFYYANRYLRKAGATDVHCLALTQTIS